MSAGGRTAPSATNVHRQANRPGPVAGWTWCDAHQAVRFGKEEGACSVDLKQNGDARFHFWATAPNQQRSSKLQSGQRRSPSKVCAKRANPTQQRHSDAVQTSETLNVNSAAHGAATATTSHQRRPGLQKQHDQQEQPSKACAKRAESTRQQPSVDVRMNEPNEKQKKSAARLKVFNLEMEAVLSLKLRKFALRALKRARHERVWRVARVYLIARATNPSLTPTPSPMRVCTPEDARDEGRSGAKRTSRPIPTMMGSPSSSTPSKSRPRTECTPTDLFLATPRPKPKPGSSLFDDSWRRGEALQ